MLIPSMSVKTRASLVLVALLFATSGQVYGFSFSEIFENIFSKTEVKIEKTDPLKIFEKEQNNINKLRQKLNFASCEEVEFIENEISLSKKRIKEGIRQLKGDLNIASLSLAADEPSDCPDMEVLELLGVPGFAETNELVMCGKADTLAFLIYIEEPGNVAGTQMTVDFKPGMQYAGFELTHYAGTSISVVDPNPDKPRFLLEGITEGVYVGYIGVTTNCDADIDALNYSVNLKFNFVYEDTCGFFQQCTQLVTPLRTYNTIIREPVLNWQTVNNSTITSLGVTQCFNLTISQDGIEAYLEEFNFQACGIDESEGLQFVSAKANGVDLDMAGYDSGTKTFSAEINGDHFPGNSNNNPADTLFDSNERVTIQLCYQIDDCPTTNTYPLKYKMSYGCNDATCQYSEIDREIRIRPNVRPEPVAEATLSKNPSVCGDPGEIDLKVYGNEADPKNGVFTDLTIGFETCEKPSLALEEVSVNGTVIPPGSYSWINDDINIDFTAIAFDPDGPGGLSDFDGDGFFDDLAGSDTLKVKITMGFQCVLPPSSSSTSCGIINCDFAQFYVEAGRDCGQSFKFYPVIPNFNITNGATYIASNEVPVGTSFVGIDFGATGTSGAKTKEVEVCYVYEQNNVTACDPANSTNTVQVVFNGNPLIVHDVEIDDPSSIEVTVNGVVQAIPPPTITWDSIDTGTRALNITAGSNNIGDTVCIKYELTVDTPACVGNIYMVGTHQIIETCDDGMGCTCTLIKGCEDILFRSNPNNVGCSPCAIRGYAYDVYRESTGYTDETMTTKVVAPDDLDLVDRNRYLPCDTMNYTGAYAIETADALNDPYLWSFGLRTFELGGGGTTVGNIELQIDSKKSELVSISVKKKDGGTTMVDMAAMPQCVAENPAAQRTVNFYVFYGNHPWEAVMGPNYQNSAESSNSSFDFYDNNRVYFGIRNLGGLEDCRQINNPTYQNPVSYDEGNCLDEFISTYNIEVGDTIFVNSRLVFTKNPFNVAMGNPATTAPRIFQDNAAQVFDEFTNSCVVSVGGCREDFVYETYCPGDVTAQTTLNIGDCGGSVCHTFKVDNPTPVNWYLNEYRPYFDIKDIDIPVYAPIMYCGNATAANASGVYPLEIKDTVNHDCATVGGELYCAVSGGSPGTIVLNPFEDNVPALGVGLGGINDTLKVTYDLCMVCPGEPTGLSAYTLVYDYQLPCEPPESRCYICNGTTAANTEIPTCLSDIGNGGNWYDYFDLDTLTIKADRISNDVTINDDRNGFPALSSTLDKSLVSSVTPGSSEEINCFTIMADGTDPTLETHKGVIAMVTVTNSVNLVDIYDATMGSLGPPILASSTATTNTYRVSLPDLAPGDSYKFNIGTTLLFCPFPPMDDPEICVSVTSGCMDPDVQAAVAANASGCNGVTECYKYVFGEAGIQSTFLTPPPGTSYPLCGEIPVAFLIKNVKAVTVTDLAFSIDLPPGMTPVPGSYEASYPNAGNLAGTFYSIGPPAIAGNTITYSEDNDFSNSIHANGFPGVTSSADSNNVVIRFMVKTICDEFTSGSQFGGESQATDPCSPDLLESGYGQSNRIIIDGANPADYAQILTTAKPAEAYCGGLTNTFKITGLNISEVPSGDSILLCITIPEELEYEPGSLQYILPSGQSVGTITTTMIGTDLRLCFAGVNNLGVGEQFTFAFDAAMKEEAECGEIDLGVEIKELIEDQACTDGGECDVFVNTSVNPFFGIDLKGPIETVDLNFSRSCSGGDDPVTMCYEVVLHNPGPDYTGDINFNLHDDLTSNNALDFFDPIMDSNLEAGFFIASGDTVTINGCFEVPAINACPVILDIIYETDCACDHNATPYFQVSPGFLDNVEPTTVLCPGQELGFEYCGDYEFALDPADGGYTYFSSDGDSVYFGLTDPNLDLRIDITGQVGECPSTDIIFLKGLVPFEAYLDDTLACVGQPKFLQLIIPPDYEDYVDISWAPNVHLSAGNISDPIFTAPAPGLYDYTVTLTFGDGCVFDYDVTVNVFPNGMVNIGGETEFCLGYEPANLTSDAGFDVYEWYLLDGGFEIIQAVTTTPAWTGPTVAGDYIVKAYRSADLCPSISPVWTVTAKGCVDLELEKEICDIDPVVHLGDSMTYCITVCNRLNPDSGLIYTVNDLEVGDVFPANLTYLGYAATEGTYIPATPESTWSIPHLAAGECETIEIYARFDQEGTFENVAEITTSDDYDDVDSEEDNDDGDQSEDDEDKESITIVFPKADIGNFVWKDLNQDGIQDGAEPPMAGVLVTLFDANTGLQVGSETTDSAGEYYFRDVQFGDYYLEFDISGVTAYAECVPTQADAGSVDANDSDILPNAKTSVFTFDPSTGDDFTFDAGFHLICEPTEASIDGGGN